VVVFTTSPSKQEDALRLCLQGYEGWGGWFSGSNIGGILQTQEMLDFCGAHKITADVEVIPIQQVNEAYERLLKSDVKYRFSIDMASLRSE